MEQNVLQELKMKNRNEAVAFLKSLWCENPQLCPLCGGKLDYLHKKAKKDNCDWKCDSCGKIYRAISILKELPNG